MVTICDKMLNRESEGENGVLLLLIVMSNCLIAV